MPFCLTGVASLAASEVFETGEWAYLANYAIQSAGFYWVGSANLLQFIYFKSTDFGSLQYTSLTIVVS